MNRAADSHSQAEDDAWKVHLNSRNCLLYEDDRGPDQLNVGTRLKPLLIPRSEAWQQSYAMHVLRELDGDHARILAARQACVEYQNKTHGHEFEAWSRAVDLCDQAMRMIEGAGAVTDDRARRILLAVCEYENMNTAFGLMGGMAESNARDFTEALRDLGATMADVPSPEALVSWAFPWL